MVATFWIMATLPLASDSIVTESPATGASRVPDPSSGAENS